MAHRETLPSAHPCRRRAPVGDTLTSTRVRLTSGVLHVESHGLPLNRTILCVPGLSANCRSFDRFVPALTDAGHRVVSVDLRGRGRSEITPPGSYGWDSHVRDLAEIADLLGLESFDVIGHSMGGFLGMMLAARFPRRCRRLALLDALGTPEPAALRSVAQSVSRLGRTYPSAGAALSYVRGSGIIAQWNEFWDNYFAWELEPFDDGVRVRTDPGAVAEDSANAAAHDVYRLWQQLACAVLVIRAKRPMAPDGGLVVTRDDAARFLAGAVDASVIDVDADHYSVLLSSPAIAAVVRFLGAATGAKP
ncbi:MAG: alpha/beta hydrolase [Mycobacterium sp.]|uniref:alpha/beta hydrolase n=1 Tax=Mycobacterium sp. TaxID=1785 RepID=UPI002624448C|nr:alpha/beta hydrolase [Mycobacterium sp.]MDI3313129.1 alpha/beta hydrolase [Mycobacterium sp.]